MDNKPKFSTYLLTVGFIVCSLNLNGMEITPLTGKISINLAQRMYYPGLQNRPGCNNKANVPYFNEKLNEQIEPNDPLVPVEIKLDNESCKKIADEQKYESIKKLVNYDDSEYNFIPFEYKVLKHLPNLLPYSVITKNQYNGTVTFNFLGVPLVLVCNQSKRCIRHEKRHENFAFPKALEEMVRCFMKHPQAFNQTELIEKQILKEIEVVKDDEIIPTLIHGFYGFNPDNCNN